MDRQKQGKEPLLKRLAVDIPGLLHKRLRIQAAVEERKIRDVIIDMAEEYLKKRQGDAYGE